MGPPLAGPKFYTTVMKRFLQNVPLFLLLLPLFFLTHLLTDYFRVLNFRDMFVPESFWYLFISLILFIVCWKSKSATMRRLTLLVFLAQFIFFFFGPIHFFLDDNVPFLGKYTVMLPLIAIFLAAAGFFLWRSRQPFYNTYQYLNILLIVLLAYEVIFVSLLNITDGRIKRLTRDFPISENYKGCDTCMNPDIYFLVFDMYANTSVLKSFWNYDNAQLEKFLDSSGFYNVKNSRSNYNFTVFSIASTLNMQYHVTDLTYTNAFRSSGELNQFEDNELFRILKKQGYKFHNYSWFHFIDAPSVVAPFVITDPQELVAAQTLWFRFKNDIAWNFKMFRRTKTVEERLSPFFLKECTYNLSRIADSYKGVKQVSAQNNTQPVFVYAHFLMPHAPFLYDSTGRVKTQLEWLSLSHQDYLEQLKYANKMMMDLGATLQKEAKRPRVIIIQSDHGYRNYTSKDGLKRDVELKNFSAFYFPGQRYQGLHDSISNVNTFRVLMNNYFDYKLPLLKDTGFYMFLR